MITMRSVVASFLLVAGILSVLRQDADAQNCGCKAPLCCSQFGYCGTGSDYCGAGCQQGPCTSGGGGGGSSLSSIVTQSFFNYIINHAPSSCEGVGFYTLSAFLSAAKSFPGFASGGSSDANKREVAAFFANAAHETSYLCYINEINGGTYCDSTNKQYPCVAGQKYYGRGPLQLSWNYNYGAAGNAIGFNGLSNPGAVASNAVTSFKSALWFWMSNVHGDVGKGFGFTIKDINGALECNGKNTAQMQDRVSKYKDLCSKLGVSPGDNLTC